MGLLEQINAKLKVIVDDFSLDNSTVTGIFPEPSSWELPSLALQSVVLFATILAFTVLKRRYFSSISHIPGPFSASFSRLWHLRQIVRGDQQVAIAKQHDKYGPFVRVAHNEVSVCHPDAVKQLFLAPLHKGDWYKIFVLPDYRTPGPVGIRDPKEKAKLNKHLNTGFQHHNIIRSEPEMNNVMIKFFSWMDKHSEEKTPVKMGDFLSYVAYDVTGEVTFSKSFGFTEKGEDIGGAIAVNEAMELFFVIFGYFRRWSLLICNPLTTWLEVLPLGYMGSSAKSALAERRENPDARFDISAYWFRALDRVGETNLHWNEDRLVAAAISNLGAGSDTVSCALQSFIYHLLRHSNGWQRIREEIDDAQKKGECQDAIISYDHAVKLVYLQAALKEALRIFAPVPMGLPRIAPKGGVKFDDTYFPEGTVLSINPYVLQTSKALWGSDATEFKPERWFASDAARLERFFCPWGAGWASCPGQHIARIEMSKIAATLVRDYDVRQVDPKEEWEWAAYFTIVPHGWPVYISRRA